MNYSDFKITEIFYLNNKIDITKISFYFLIMKYENTFTGDLENTKQISYVVPLYITIIF